MTDCTYCGCEVEAHDPVVVHERAPGEVDDANATAEADADAAADAVEDVDAFCNWGCLSAYAAESDVATGTTCNWTPDA